MGTLFPLAVRLELWAALIALAASAVLPGCGHARGCIEGCGAVADSGSDAGAEAGLPLPPACPAHRICPHVFDIHAELEMPLGDQNRGTVYLGNAVYTPVGPAVSWVSMPLHAGDPRHAGVALPLQNKVASFVENVAADAYPEAPPLLQRDNELDLVVPSTSYDQVIRVPMDTFVPSNPAPIPISGVEHDPPTVLGIGQTLAAIVKPSYHLVFVDSTLSQRLVDKPISGDLLTPTCNGFLAVNSGIGQAQPFDDMGNAVGPVVSWNGGSGGNPAWDGASVAICEAKQIVELASNGSVQSVTPTPPDADRGAEVAVGTDDGLLSSMVVGGPPALRMLERGTGSIIEDYGTQQGDVAVAGDHSIYFISGSGYAGSCTYWTWVECSD